MAQHDRPDLYFYTAPPSGLNVRICRISCVSASNDVAVPRPGASSRRTAISDLQTAPQTKSRRIGPQVGHEVRWIDSVTLSDGDSQGRTRADPPNY
jgi:hypothetical protein